MNSIIDVLKKRQGQINKGYTVEHDDEHTPEQILAFGGVTWSNPTRMNWSVQPLVFWLLLTGLTAQPLNKKACPLSTELSALALLRGLNY